MGKVADKVVAIEIDKTLIPILRETLGEFDNIEVVNQDILKVEDRLIYKLETIRNLKELFHEDIVEYEEGLLELDEARQVFNEALRKAGLAILMWSRAHLQLSRGVTEPAEIDIMNLMLGVGKKFVPGL